MKNTQKRKALQAKLNHYISELTATLTKTESKKLKKAIKKASRLVAKAILKNSDESEVEVSLKDIPADTKTTAKSAVVKKRRITAGRRKPARLKRAVKSAIQEKPVKGNSSVNNQPEAEIAGK